MKPKTARSNANSDLLSSSSAAKLAGVTPSTIKRWADEGRLQCERTAGGHRRFRKSILMRFLRGNSNTEQVNDEVQKWVMTLVSGSHYSAVSELYRLRQEMGCWAKTATALEPVIEEIGNAWANDRITVAQEHRASECLARAIWQVGNAMPSLESPPVAVLATAEGDQHELGLRLAELCLRNQQWATIWVGANTPTEVVVELLNKETADMLLLSASPWMLSKERLDHISKKLSAICKEKNITLILGGKGKWPETELGIKVSSFEDFNAIINEIRPR